MNLSRSFRPHRLSSLYLTTSRISAPWATGACVLSHPHAVALFSFGFVHIGHGTGSARVFRFSLRRLLTLACILPCEASRFLFLSQFPRAEGGRLSGRYLSEPAAGHTFVLRGP